MKLIAKKPCSFGGKQFYIGDEIPVESVLDPKAQEKMGVLAIVNDDAATPAPVATTMAVVVHAEEGDLTLDLTQAGLQAVVDVLTSKADDAKPIVDGMEDPDALILLHMTDNRKTVKEAAEARAKALQEAGETAEEPQEAESEGDQ